MKFKKILYGTLAFTMMGTVSMSSFNNTASAKMHKNIKHNKKKKILTELNP